MATPAPSWSNATGAPTPAPQTTTVEDHQDALFSTYSTLDEPVRETILRDVRAVGAKLKVVIRPLSNGTIVSAYQSVSQSVGTNEETELSEEDRRVIQELKDWDLWGPLLLCLTLAVLLSMRSTKDQASLVFASVFCAVWVGGTVVTLNAQLLGGTISFFQCLCVLGYSIFPLVLAAACIAVLSIAISWKWLHLIFVAVGFVWSIRTSFVFIGIYIKPERRFLALYPVLFFYTFLGWLILLF